MKKKPKEDNLADPGPVRVITQFGARWNTVRDILQKHWEILTNTPDLANIVGPSPKMVARRANLGDTLITSEFTKESEATWLSQYPRSKGMFSCGHCQVYPFVDRTDTYKDELGKESFQIWYVINCSTTKVVYMLTCPYDKFYIGKMKRQLRICIGEHMREIVEKTPDKPLVRHFAQYHNGWLEGMQVKGIYMLRLSPRGNFNLIILQKEKWWIYRLKFLLPNGLNTELNLQVYLEE